MDMKIAHRLIKFRLQAWISLFRLLAS